MDRQRIYRSYEKDDAQPAFGLKLLLPFGVGSYVKDDTGCGTYGTLPDLRGDGANVWIVISIAACSYEVSFRSASYGADRA